MFLTDLLQSLEKQQLNLGAELQSKILETQKLASVVSEISKMLSCSKEQLEHILSISYENCRKVANAAIGNSAARRAIFERDGWKCKECGSEDLLSIDHIVPVVRGGGNHEDNLQTLCLPCNLKKGPKYSRPKPRPAWLKEAAPLHV